MELSSLIDYANALIHTRQHVAPRRLVAPGPSELELHDILRAAGAAPDHGQLLPWRFVVVPGNKRELLAEVFALALQDRDPAATPAQIEAAREKAYRSPFLMLAIARLMGSTPEKEAQRAEAGELVVTDAERLISLGCAMQNLMLMANALGFGSGITSGQALTSPRLRTLFELHASELAVCCISIGTVSKGKPPRQRPAIEAFVSSL